MAMRCTRRGSLWLLAFVAAMTLCLALAFALALYPKAEGITVYEDQGVTVDASHADQGYVMVRHTPSDKALKLRLTKGEQTYTYDLPADGRYETYPLNMGSGTYQVQVFRQISGKRYANDASLRLKAEIADETIPYLYPNQFVWYTPDSAAVAMGETLCAGLTSDADKLDAVRRYVVDHILYDYIQAETVQSGYLPAVDEILAGGKGICFDYAALTACMLRTQGVPTKLVIGYADRIYHAWNDVLVDGEWRRIDTTAEANNMKVKRYTQERIY